jgi:hypothetical protein
MWYDSFHSHTPAPVFGNTSLPTPEPSAQLKRTVTTIHAAGLVITKHAHDDSSDRGECILCSRCMSRESSVKRGWPRQWPCLSLSSCPSRRRCGTEFHSVNARLQPGHGRDVGQLCRRFAHSCSGACSTGASSSASVDCSARGHQSDSRQRTNNCHGDFGQFGLNAS